MLKKLAFSVCMSVAMTANAAVFIANNEDQTNEWWAYAETVTRLSDGYTVMIGRRFLKESKSEARMYYGVKFADCDKGFGTLYMRETPTSQWSNDTIVSMRDRITVADIISSEICSVYEKEKTTTKKSSKASKTSI